MIYPFAKIILPAVLLAAALLVGEATAQQDDPPKIVDIRVGFNNRYKVGNWVPVKITFRGGSRRLTGAVTLSVPDGDGIPSSVTTPGNRPLLVMPGLETSVTLFARFGRVDSTALVRFHVDGKVPAKREYESRFDTAGDGYYLEAASATQPLYLVIGAGGMGVEKAVALANQHEEDLEPLVVHMDNLEQLPTRWYGYEGVDAVVLSTSRPELYSKLQGEDDARLAALDEWIRMGGRLVLSVGANGEDVLGAGMPLTRCSTCDTAAVGNPTPADHSPFPKAAARATVTKTTAACPSHG